MRLLEIADELQALDELLYECDGDLTDPRLAACVDAWFAELEGKAEEKVAGYIGLIRERELRAAALSEESERLERRGRSERGAADWLRATLRMFMERRGVKRFQTDRGNATVCAAGGKAPVVIDDEHGVTPTYLVPQPPRVDKDAIRADLEAGVPLTFAHLGERGTYLRIA